MNNVGWMVRRFFFVLAGLSLILAGGFAGCSNKNRAFDPAGGAAGTGQEGGSGSGGLAGAGPTDACTLGEVSCQGTIPLGCSAKGEWFATRAACAVACLRGECVACQEGDHTCKDGAVQVCTDGRWLTDRVCDKACEGGACVDACTEGGSQCNGNQMLQKCMGGAYVTDKMCEFLCSNSACSGACVPDTKRCNPDAMNESQSCDAHGNWGATSACVSGTFCVAGDCKPCKPGTSRCSDSGPQLCSSTGEWVNQGGCSTPKAACFQGACVACTPGDLRCSAHAVERCLPDGSDWEVATTCGGATPACLDSTKACGKCSKDETQCFNDEVQTCDDKGAFQTTETCTGTTPQCSGKKCVECDPDAGEHRCATTSSTQACTSNGSWGAATTCTGDTPLCRADLNFACGCKENARRCRSNTVPEVCQGGTWVAQSACSGALDYCLPSSGQCVDCAPTATECLGAIAQQCNDQGTWQSLNSCTGPGVNCGNCDVGEACTQSTDCKTAICVGKKCAICQPGARDCVGVTPRLCSTAGAWTNQTACSGATPECLASTGLCVACQNGSTRNCGSCSTGTQTCTNNAWGSCTGAVDLQTSKQYCGSCTTSCTSGQLCQSGACVKDCGSQTLCGSTCTNTSADPLNCLGCGNKCTGPASNGSAVCSASGCDISCNNTRCGTSCCGATPSGAQAGCSGNTCAFTCSTGNHGCGTTAPPCYTNADVDHCGSSCLDCSKYIGTADTCTSGQCACKGASLACGANVPTCGTWDFNTNTLEGWRYGSYYPAAQQGMVGPLHTATTNGSPALATSYKNTTGNLESAEFSVDLCPNMALLNLANYKLSYDVYFLTTSGSKFATDNGVDTLLADGSGVILSCQPFLSPASDQWNTGTCSNLPSAMKNLTIVLRPGTWTGDIYIDNVRFTLK